MVILVLVLLGLCFGSFVNALVFRLHKQSKKGSVTSKQGSANKKQKKQTTENRLLKTDSRYSIMRGRSMCVNCKHVLSAGDLIPVASWLILRGKCRYCKKPISRQYPAVELATTVLFVLSYIFWPNDFTGFEPVYFAFWLVYLVGFMGLIVYDIKWMMLPNKIIFFLYGVVALETIIRLIDEASFHTLVQTFFGVVVGGGLFYLLFQVSKGKWIGGGDVKLGFLLGAIVASPVLAMLVLFFASLLGCLYTIPLMLAKKANRSSRIPFGPFLILGTIVVVLFGQIIIDGYFDIILGVRS